MQKLILDQFMVVSGTEISFTGINKPFFPSAAEATSRTDRKRRKTIACSMDYGKICRREIPSTLRCEILHA